MERIKELLSHKRTKLIVLVILDVLVLFMSSFLAIGLRFDFTNIPINYINNIYKYFVIDAIILVLVNIFYRIYKNMWSYASITELLVIYLLK